MFKLTWTRCTIYRIENLRRRLLVCQPCRSISTSNQRTDTPTSRTAVGTQGLCRPMNVRLLPVGTCQAYRYVPPSRLGRAGSGHPPFNISDFLYKQRDLLTRCLSETVRLLHTGRYLLNRLLNDTTPLMKSQRASNFCNSHNLQ